MFYQPADLDLKFIYERNLIDMKEIKNKPIHNTDCTCPICNSTIREERQYAAMRVSDDAYVIIDAVEHSHMYEYISSDKKACDKLPKYDCVMPKDDSKKVLAYGVLLPQYGSVIDNWQQELDIYKNYALAALEDDKLYMSAYSDYKLYPDDAVYNFHIPIALLLDPSIDFHKELDFGFGHTCFVKYSNLNIFDNILSRPFLFCLGGIEENFDGDEVNWQKCVDRDKLVEIARRLF